MSERSHLSNTARTLINNLNRNNIFPPPNNRSYHLLSRRLNGRTIRRKPHKGYDIFSHNVYHEARRIRITDMRVIKWVAYELWKSATSNDRELYMRLADHINRQ
ncbi:5043_t:CDS:1 [Acaulospora morrowiae]|uniref:5043_t:CDS:1 n=1 Tax=Acaulospora morrowiae TaxID=94023 RepID=A0A9N9FKB7_9GLOM|nr:5043_t:CDS:1 [Acaulospora morrowiae]